jgi:DNA-binding NarL/FixJ family response regulator
MNSPVAHPPDAPALARAVFAEIAEALNLSVKTVSVYRARLLEKMNLRNNAELTHYGLKHGLAE